MNKVVREGLDLAQQIAALPFKAARQALQETTLRSQPLGDVIEESLTLGEGLAKLPFKAAAALAKNFSRPRPDLEERVARLEQQAEKLPPPA